MDIHVLDWIMFGVLGILLDKLLPDDIKEELGGTVGCVFNAVYILLYCIVFYFYNWIDFINYIRNLNIKL